MLRRSPPLPGKSAHQPDANSGGTTDLDLIRPEPTTGSGRFFVLSQSGKGDDRHEKHRENHGKDRGPVQKQRLNLPSEIYGGLANTWDYGPSGVELKNNVKKAW